MLKNSEAFRKLSTRTTVAAYELDSQAAALQSQISPATASYEAFVVAVGSVMTQSKISCTLQCVATRLWRLLET